jgi:ferredoxin
MKNCALQFSPTGGVKRVMDILASELSIDGQVDLSDPETDFSSVALDGDGVCLIGVPSFGGRVPGIAIERLRKTNGNGSATAVVCVFGNRAYEDTLLELKTEAEAAGYKVVAAIAAVAEHSIMRQHAKNRPDEADELELRGYAKEIQRLAADKDKAGDFTVPGNSPYKSYGGSSLKPKADESCLSCGLCAEKCPVQAIPKDNPALTENEKCISCMRCVAICPNGSRKLDEQTIIALTQATKKVFEGRKLNEMHS